MKGFGVLLMVIGAITMLTGCSLDAAAPGAKVLNIGMLNDKTNVVLVGVAFFIGGAIFATARPDVPVAGGAAGVAQEEAKPFVHFSLSTTEQRLAAGGLGFIALMFLIAVALAAWENRPVAPLDGGLSEAEAPAPRLR